MANVIQDDHEKSFLEKLNLYFENYPGRCCDLSFIVGRGDEKEVVQTSRIILEVACPEFMKLFDESWGQAVALSTTDISGVLLNGIPLPDVDPNAFKILLKLLVLSDVSVDSLIKFNIPSEDLLNVVELCKKYKMLKIQKNLETITQKTLLGSTGETALKFNGTERTRDTLNDPAIKTLQLLNGVKVVRDPVFRCNGSNYNGLLMTVNQEIDIFSLGFLGPIHSDSYYEVTVEICHFDGAIMHLLCNIRKRVFAKKHQVFYVSFDQPIRLKATYANKDWNGENYFVKFSLKGPTIPVPDPGNRKEYKDFHTETDEGTRFFCRIYSTPLAELCFKKC